MTAACDPSSPSNQYILQFKEGTVQLLETVCHQANEAGEGFDFAAVADQLRDEIKGAKITADSTPNLPAELAPLEYLRGISNEQIDAFIDEYTAFT